MELGVVKILLNKRWRLEDFSVLSKEYIQLYGLFYSLIFHSPKDKASNFYSNMPWEGGHSVVHFFGGMSRHIDGPNKPIVKKNPICFAWFHSFTRGA